MSSWPLRWWDKLMIVLVLLHLAGALLAPFFPDWLDHGLWAGMCHQDDARSFAWSGNSMPLCGRCTGILAGFLLARVFYRPADVSLKLMAISWGLMLSMILEWKLSHEAVFLSSNLVRLITGIGFGVGYLLFFHLGLLRMFDVLFERPFQIREWFKVKRHGKAPPIAG